MDTELSPTRAPLTEKANSPPPKLKRVRRKCSFIRRIDSSEDCPSPHDSIYEAYHITASDESLDRVEQSIPILKLHKADTRTSNIENERKIENSEFRYGRGTILNTITEKNSDGTMRSAPRARSADNLHNIPFLGHRDSFLLSKSPRRQHSFSLDDVHLINRSYHEVCHEIYASPKVPLRDPVERPGTPPGLPSWTAAQTLPPSHMPRSSYNIHRTSSRIQRFLGRDLSARTFSVPIARLEATRVASAPVTLGSSRQSSRFRPPRSAYGPISRHPFNNAPIATVSPIVSPIKRVRFTPSATARDSAEVNLRNAIESTSPSAIHPIARIQPMLPIAQTDSGYPKKRICSHRKRLTPPTVAKTSLNVRTCVSVRTTRNNFVTSTAPLMSGGRSGGLTPEALDSTAAQFEDGLLGLNSNLIAAGSHHGDKREIVPCWKCLFEKLFERAGKFWAQTSSCLCFVCCGYECDDESTVSGGYVYGTGTGYFDQCADSRQHVLEQTPASMI